MQVCKKSINYCPIQCYNFLFEKCANIFNKSNNYIIIALKTFRIIKLKLEIIKGKKI